MIKKSWAAQKEIKNVMLFLQEQGISTALGHRIYKVYGDNSITVMRKNPYQLVDDVYGIGFKTADQIAAKLGMDKESFNRCRSGIFYVLSQLSNEGHCYTPFDELVQKCVDILDIEEQKIIMTVGHLVFENELMKEQDDKIYLPPFFHAEVGTSRRIKAIMNAPNNNAIQDINSAIEKVQHESGIVYNEVQINAVKLAAQSKFSVITGGPGTGKSVTRSLLKR